MRPRCLLPGVDTPQKFLEKEKDFPFYFLPGAVRHHLGWGTRTSRSSRLKKLAPDPHVSISPEEGAVLGLEEGDEIRIISRKGEIQAIIHFDPDLSRGLIFAPHGYPGIGENRLLDHLWDGETKSQLQKGCAVRIERIDDEPERDDAA
jgi:assimilatory nitrate reductase catalytic subunit